MKNKAGVMEFFLSATERYRLPLLMVVCILALLPFWLLPLDPSHDMSLQWQAGYDFSRNGTLYHQAKDWPHEFGPREDGYDQQWMTDWPPGYSALIAAGVILGQPVLWMKLFFSLIFMGGWILWLKIVQELTDKATFGLPRVIGALFPFLPVIPAAADAGFVYGQSMFPSYSSCMTDWMMFLLCPAWYLAIRQFLKTGAPRMLGGAIAICLGLFYIKYSALSILLATLLLLLFWEAPWRSRAKAVITSLLVFGAGTVPIWFFNARSMAQILMGGRSAPISVMATAHRLFKNITPVLADIVSNGFYHLLKASGLGPVTYLVGIGYPLLHRVSRAAFLGLVILLLLRVGRRILSMASANIDLKIQGALIASVAAFISLLTLTTGIEQTGTFGRVTYFMNYRYFLPIVPLVFILFWRSLISIDCRFIYLLISAIGLNLAIALGSDLLKIRDAMSGEGLWASLGSLYNESDYGKQKATREAVRILERTHPGLTVFCFRYEIDRGFDRYGIVRGYELRRETMDREFYAKRQIAIVLVVPRKDSPRRSFAPNIDLDRYHHLEIRDVPTDHELYYRLVGPGSFKI